MAILKLKPRWFIGTIENVDDETNSGLVQVRCMGVHLTDKSLLPTKYLPWAKLMLSPTSASANGVGRSPTGVVAGSMCWGFALDAGFTDLKVLSTWHAHDDVNILARNDNEDELKASIVQSKKGGVEKGVKAVGVSWDEPITPYAAKYPMNDVEVSRAGHVFEIDNTPEAERLHWYHKAGTFQEVHPDGTKVIKVVGDDFEVYLKDRNVLVKGSCNLTIMGDANVDVRGNKNETIGGNLVQDVKGSITQTVGGSRTATIKGSDTHDAQSVTLKAKSDATMESGGTANVKASGATTVKGSTLSLN